MKYALAIAAAAMLSGTTMAGDFFTLPSGATGWIGPKPSAIIVASPQLPLLTLSQPVEIFRLGDGGCLRGPLEFFDAKGGSMFKLDAGAEFPAGCGPEKAK